MVADVIWGIAGSSILETFMTTNVEGAAGDIAADLAALRQDVARLAEAMRELLQNQTQAAGHRVSEAVGDARDKIASTAVDAQNRVRAASGEIEAGIARNPLIAVLIAFGVGMSLGLMSRSHY
jgi:ElaB/YqjD/DUF883 family membrane-anchored ribosome-binding protein